MPPSCPPTGRGAIWATIPIMWLTGASHASSWPRWSPRRRVMENQPMLDLVFHARFRWKLWPRQITGDTTYGTIENIVAVEDQHLRAYVPLPDFDKRTSVYSKQAFRYDPERDVYECPNNAILPLHTHAYNEREKRYQADATTCNACPLKAQCTTSDQGRLLKRSFDEEYLEQVRAYHTTEPYQKAMRKRSVWVEPLFAEGKQWHGMRRFRLRLLWRANCEALLIAAGQNLKRLLKKRGWGRRPYPAEAVCALFLAAFGWFTRTCMGILVIFFANGSDYVMVRKECIPLD